jgi:hypothetical protein
VIGVDDSIVIGLITTFIGILISALVAIERRISSVYRDMNTQIAELGKRIGEISGKLEMLIKYINNNKR